MKDEIASPVFRSDHSRSTWSRRITALAVATLLITLGAVLWFGFNTSTLGTVGRFPVVTTNPVATYPVGTTDHASPSGKAPPGATALAGYTLSYVNDFTDPSLPKGWYLFSGVPSGLSGGQFATNHVVIHGGVLRLETRKDPKFGNKWVSGGLCQCGLRRTYGAYFVRSRLTASGPNEVQLLWPASDVWPPEIDFNETGASARSTSWTVHWGSANHIDQQSIFIDMLRWHTWGVVWTPRSITFTVDGKQWGQFTNALDIPKEPMSLHFEQLASCSSARYCPNAPASMLIDWVAEYSRP